MAMSSAAAQPYTEAFSAAGSTNTAGAGATTTNLGNFYNFSLFENASTTSAPTNNTHHPHQHPQHFQAQQHHHLNGLSANDAVAASAAMQHQQMLMAAAYTSASQQATHPAFVHGHPSQHHLVAAHFARNGAPLITPQHQHLFVGDGGVVGHGGNHTLGESSGEFDESMNGQYDDDELLEMCDDPVMRERLMVVQQVQEAASSEGASGMFGCPYCDKQYAGKHARSIWRRHLQDKHAIPLSQQPRRTRWDGDVNRPKNAEERRQRMLESKRRWARKKRLMDKAANTGGVAMVHSPTDSADQDEVESALQHEAEAELAAAEADDRVNANNDDSAAAAAPPSKKRTNGNANGTRSRGMQQIKFHHITTTDMPSHPDAYNTGTITAVWNNANQKSGHSMAEGSLASARGFAKHTSMPSRILSRPINVNSDHAIPNMFTASTSPRRILSEIDANRENGIRPASATSNKKAQFDVHGSMLMPAPGAFDVSAVTPMNRFTSLYPTPPSTNDAKTLAAQVFGGGYGKNPRQSTSAAKSIGGPLSPPASQHNLDSSPSSMLATTTRALNGRHNASAMLSPVSSSKRVSHQSPAVNPFSLDQHKISPATGSTGSRALLAGLEPPSSSSRLTGALKDEGRHSPLQSRLGLWNDVDASDMLTMSGSPIGKARKLPPLVKTPLRRAGKDEEGGKTPGYAMSLLASGTSVRKSARFASVAANATTTIGSATTPTRQQDRLDKLFGGSALGFTPFDARNGGGASSKYSVSRSGYFTRASPGKGLGVDQFSSPQHLNLTQSLGLAPHSVSKTNAGLLGGMNSLNSTPYINSFLSNSPWPDSVLRPSYRTSASKRGSPESSKDGAGGGTTSRGSKRSSSDDDEGDEEDDGHAHSAAHETPSRPAKRPHSSLLGTGSPSQRQLRSSASRSNHELNGSQSLIGSADNSSAGRSRRSYATSRRPSELPPLSFKLYSPSSSNTTDTDDAESHPRTSSAKKRNGVINALSFDKELMQQDHSPSGLDNGQQLSSDE